MNLKKLLAIFKDDFKKTDEARNFIADKIKDQKINKTEGLLLMNYTSDDEVKILRKKYNI